MLGQEQAGRNKKEVIAVSRGDHSHAEDIKITNDMQVAMVKLFRPGIEGKREFNQALAEFVPIHGENFSHLVEVDARVNSGNKLTNLWRENRGQDPHLVLPFIKNLLETLRSLDNLIASTSNEQEKEALRKKFDEHLAQAVRNREGVL